MFKRRVVPTLLLLGALSAGGLARAGDMVLIGHPSVPRLDPMTVERIYTGRVVEVDGVRVTPINRPAGDPQRNRFLARWLGRDEDQYTGYWTLRRYVGKGVPPMEAVSAAEVIRLVNDRPGSIGYVDEAELRAGMNVLAR